MDRKTSRLPRGHIRATIQMEGKAMDVARKIVGVLEGLPREDAIEALRQAGKKAGVDVDKIIHQKARTPVHRRRRQ